MLYFVVDGVAFDVREEAEAVASVLNANMQLVDAMDELHAVSIAASLNEVGGSVRSSSRNSLKEEQADIPPPA